MNDRRLFASDPDGSATSLVLYTPAQTTPDSPITLTGTYQGDPDSLDYSFGSGWITASTVTFDDGMFSITVPGGIPAGSYMPEVRDHTATSVTSTAGTFVVNGWTPETLTSSPGAAAVFEFNANNPNDTVVGSDGDVSSVINSLDPSESLKVELATDGNPVTVAENSGAEGESRVLQFHATTQNQNNYDASTDWLGAGGVKGSAGATLVDLANSSDLATSGSFTTIISLYIDKSYSYEAGPIWGSLSTPGPLQYAQLRYNNGSGEAGAQIVDKNLVGAEAQSTISAGWHVMTMIKDDGTLTYRLDGHTIATTTITSTAAFTASDFLIGGGFPPASGSKPGEENGVPPPDVGEFQAYSGVLAGSDLVNAEKLAGNSVGLTLNPTAPCFAAGTRILTVRGEIAVEDLRAGDLAVTRSQGIDTPQRIVWVGKRQLDVASHPRPELVRPVRFEPDALSAGSPTRPLLLSPDHALLLDGVLIAARQLVNGGSISVADVPVVQYFHVELERHGILLAEGVEAESYLDTGNRHQFAGCGPLIALHPDFSSSRRAGSCAPMVTGSTLVWPIWQRLAERSVVLGQALALPAVCHAAELRLVLHDGCELAPERILADGRHVFMLHKETNLAPGAWLRSRHAAPATLRPWEDDRRELGVGVGGIAVWTRQTGLQALAMTLDDPALSSGWWDFETDGAMAWRWTDGNASLILPDGCLRLDVSVVATADYVETPGIGLRHAS